ncbi:C47 family peptidase [Lactococcus lactis]|uniref:Uncharacterized protein YjdB n=1 Tax=Lactococcus lactis TaxID=1358 RepID=A0AAW5TRP3_9LACT|nr:C47 family peptidase [Lactococcus lactis]MCW2280947.1 uncharacterized protein YjdB [Lactococcus lactis]
MIKLHSIIKQNRLKSTAIFGILLLLFSSLFAPIARAFTIGQNESKQDNISVNIKQIDELKDVFAHGSSKPTNTLEQTLVNVLAKDKVGDFGNFTVNASPEDVLRYTYPNATEAQLQTATINGQQAVNWLHHVGYTATLINRALTTDEIKKQLDNSCPIIPIMVNQNQDNWLNHCLAGVLYAHDDVTIDGQNKLNKSFIKAMGYGETTVQDGQETQPITFPDQTNSPDPIQASDSYLWTQTISDIKLDPSAVNIQSINTNVKDGIFKAQTTKMGNGSQVEFTDPLLASMKPQVADSPLLTCSAQVQKKGWLPECQYGEPVGTMEEGLRLEAFKLKLRHLPQGLTGGITYSAHVQNQGWQNEVSDGAIAGTVGKSLRVEAIKVRLTGTLAQQYSVYYSTYSNKNWCPFVKDNQISGTTGKGLKIEAIMVHLIRKKNFNGASNETKRAAVALANAYEDAEHQKTVTDLEKYAKINPSNAITSQQIMDWYHFLGLEFDTQKGRFTKAQAMTMNQSGRLYFTFLKAKKAPDNIQNFGAIGYGYMDNSFSYTPNLSYMNEPYAPTVCWQQRKGENFTQTNNRMKTYDYDKIYTLNEEGKEVSEYEEEVTLYNIRAKASTNKADSTPSTPEQSTPTSLQATGATYQENPNFIPSGVQGSEPWCSEYVNASEINLLNHMTAETPATSRLTAEQLMQALYPTVNAEQLKTMNGGLIGDILKVLKEKYQVTADVENRALNFKEVKRELDSGNIVQMDLDNKDREAGESNELAHSVAIIGYVLPANGDTSKAPYYKIWNPWGQEFYVSSKSDTINLGGVRYQWTRTWHNWRKVGARTQLNINKAIIQQKAASMCNPNIVSTFNLPDYLHPFEEKDIFHQKAGEFGNNIQTYNSRFFGLFSISISNNSKRAISSRHLKTKKTPYNYMAQQYRSDIIKMHDLDTDISKWGIGTAVIAGLLTAIQFIPVIDEVVDLIITVVGLATGGGIDFQAGLELGNLMISLIDTQKHADSIFKTL